MNFVSPLIALTIAGFDPVSGAGITADLKTFSAHGLYGVACITAMTVQSTLGVRSVESQSTSLVRQTLECLANDVSFAGVKIGMLGSHGVASEVSSFLSTMPNGLSPSRIVLDPVLHSSSGTALLDQTGILVVRDQLLQQVGWITPNIDELRILAGDEAISANVPDLQLVIHAARRLKQLAARRGNEELNIVVTGGHLSRPDDLLVAASGEETWLPGEWVATKATHGTGCAYSSALLCGLIAGQAPLTAAASAKAYVAEALRLAYPIGQGKGPMNHLFPLRSRVE